MTPFYVRAVLFDMDGTLVDSTPLVERVWSRWAAQHSLDASQVTTFAHGRPTEEVIRAFLPGLDAVTEAASLLAEEELDPTPIQSIPGALEAVAVASQYSKWAVVTSASRKLAGLRLALGGFPSPPVLVSADDIEHGKPDPEGFLRAAEALGQAPEECLVFEDTPAGLQAGHAAGARIIGLSTTFPASVLPADIIVPDFTSVSMQPSEDGSLLVSVFAPEAVVGTN
ncbi:MAG: HAD-IA family hydrolase [Bryobacteraceae bacterium]